MKNIYVKLALRIGIILVFAWTAYFFYTMHQNAYFLIMIFAIIYTIVQMVLPFFQKEEKQLNTTKQKKGQKKVAVSNTKRGKNSNNASTKAVKKNAKKSNRK